ncbi:uncharacterized protein B0I36DRAFT_326607 [Microdochium trichocladiopsis]|uniref:Uncharacterized protein n=1 Tax=Microdochium trichocladiopsis TaxID=1682393 RepID=A0A9P8Y133_9PEZI|nr:uncharacterized protein B0I36DRAFT_326607 [Microdochium trichocladiopsis]KAH7027181.1 hypothetical protein B0I36DRAFT_326607 [Microdochium trichocladiopsis]
MFPESAPAFQTDNHPWSSAPEFQPQYSTSYFNPYHSAGPFYYAFQSVRPTEALGNAEVLNKLNEFMNQLDEVKCQMAELSNQLDDAKGLIAELSRESRTPVVKQHQPRITNELTPNSS